MVIGFVRGALVLGGGVLLVPVLMWLFQFDQLKAAGTALGVLVIAIIPGVVLYFLRDKIDYGAAFWIAIGFASGAFAGANTALSIPRSALPNLRMCFGFVLLFIGMRYVIAFDREVFNAAIALTVVGISWLIHWVLKLVGKKYQPKTMEDTFNRMKNGNAPEPDYYI